MCIICSTEVTRNTSGGTAPGEAGAWCSEDPRFPSRSEDMVLDLIEQPTGVELESVFPDKIKRRQGRVYYGLESTPSSLWCSPDQVM